MSSSLVRLSLVALLCLATKDVVGAIQKVGSPADFVRHVG